MDFLLRDPVDSGRLPADELLGLEPERDLLLRGLDGVGAVADVAADLDAEVSPDGARLRVLGVGLSEHDPAGGHHVEALPDHGQDGAGRHVLDQPGEEGLRGQVGVVLPQVILGRLGPDSIRAG